MYAARAIRALVVGRRNYLFAGSGGGGETATRLYSLIGSCRLSGIDPNLYLDTYLVHCQPRDQPHRGAAALGRPNLLPSALLLAA